MGFFFFSYLNAQKPSLERAINVKRVLETIKMKMGHKTSAVREVVSNVGSQYRNPSHSIAVVGLRNYKTGVLYRWVLLELDIFMHGMQ